MLLFAFCAAVMLGVPPAHAQRSQVTIDFKNESFASAVRFLENTYGYDFTYRTEDVTSIPAITLSMRGATIEAVMRRILQNSGLTFRIDGRSVIISKAQTVNAYRGRVLNADGNPLVGATVFVKGTTTGTMTDADGNFLIPRLTGSDHTFIFSYVGYKTVERRITNTDFITVQLEEDAAAIEDIIVTGYQEILPTQFVGSSTVLKNEDLIGAADHTIMNRLAGEVPGMVLVTESGESHATPKIRIRGISTINGAKAPLWVLDGMILEDPVNLDYSDLNSPDAEYLIGTAIAGINPQDIETITVLKDAAATSVYGIRAANGVIVVTTKKGRPGNAQVSYSGSVTFKARQSYRSLNLMNASERIDLSRDIIADGVTYEYSPRDVGYEGLYYRYLSKELSYGEFEEQVQRMADRNTDWYDLLFRDTFSTNHTVSLSGGNSNTTYYGSLGYSNNPDPGRKSKAERYSANIRLRSNVARNLLVDFKLNSSLSKNTGYHSATNPNSWAYNTSRTIPAYNDDGSYYFYEQANTWGSTGPYRTISYLNELEQTGADSETIATNAQLELQWRISDLFRYTFSGSVQNTRAHSRNWATEESYQAAVKRGYPLGTVTPGSEEEMESALPYGGMLNNTESNNTAYRMINQLDFNITVADDHNIGAWVASEISSQVSKGLASTIYGWTPDGQQVMPYVTGSNYSKYESNGVLSPSITDYTFNTVSWIGNLNYNYRDLWTAFFSVRMDGSSAFGENPDYRFLPIWSAGMRWNISNERLMQNVDWIDELALRASYGVQGNVDKSTSPDLVIRRAKLNSDRGWYGSNVAFYPNKDLRWEKTVSVNAGLDFIFLRGRLSGAFDFYHKSGSDLILERNISAVNGMEMVNKGATAYYLLALSSPTYKINGGKMNNTGVELGLNAHIVKNRNFDFTMQLTYGYNKNKIVKATGHDEAVVQYMLNGNAHIEGRPLGEIYSFALAGLGHENGYPYYYDKQGNSQWYSEEDGRYYNYYFITESDAMFNSSGVIYPTSQGKIGLGFRWKNLSLNMNFLYTLGAVARLPAYYGDYDKVFDPTANLTKDFNKRWRQPGDEAHTNLPALYDDDAFRADPEVKQYPNPLGGVMRAGLQYFDNTDARVASTDNIRLKSVSLRYIIPHHFCKRFGASSADVSFQATDLFLIAHKAWNGFDPESGRSANVPIPKTFTLSLNLRF